MWLCVKGCIAWTVDNGCRPEALCRQGKVSLLDSEVEAQVKADNSATRQIANKLKQPFPHKDPWVATVIYRVLSSNKSKTDTKGTYLIHPHNWWVGGVHARRCQSDFLILTRPRAAKVSADTTFIFQSTQHRWIHHPSSLVLLKLLFKVVDMLFCRVVVYPTCSASNAQQKHLVLWEMVL